MNKALFKIIKQAYLYIWKKIWLSSENIHLPAKMSQKFNIPFSSSEAFLRKSSSDAGRVSEYISEIYQKDSYLHDALKDSRPSILIDIGANIGLSSLSMIHAFSSLKRVIAIEAEVENYRILKRNFELWEQKYPSIEFSAIHAVATNDEAIVMKPAKSLGELTSKNSVSGTFRFVKSDSLISKDGQEQCKSISINKIFDDISVSENIIVKVDIEGGEEYLFSSNTNWIKRCSFITMELHDRFHPKLINSSKNTIKVLSRGDFALAASEDVLYCYNRGLIFNSSAQKDQI